MGRIIGIDLGTTNSCVAVLEGGVPKVINSRQGERTLPSVVALSADGKTLVGTLAKRQAVMNPTRTVHAVKRLMGRKRDSREVGVWRRGISYNVVAASNGDAWVQLGDTSMSPPEVSAIVLRELKAMAEDYLGDTVTDAVITVPAYFNDNQRQATKDAGAIAGLNVKRILNEPTAAALAYGLRKDKDQTFAVFDLGGGTFDVTILRSVAGVAEVLATNGDTFLGGDDFDIALMDHLLEDFQRANGLDLRTDACALQRVKEASETAKRELSRSPTTAVSLPFLATGPNGPLHIKIERLDRAVLEKLVAPLIDRLETPCLAALQDANIQASDLDQVIIVGGMTRMPAVQAKVEAIFGKRPARDVNPDEIIALGAAVQCGVLSGDVQEVVLLDVTPHSLGVRLAKERMSVVIPKNTTIPTSERTVLGTTQDNQDHVIIEVYQGEADVVDENAPIGRFTLEGLPRKKKGQVYVEITFTIDADGVVNVTAREVQSGVQTSVRLQPSGGLSRAEVERARVELNKRVKV
jgi:molecular chaperone DnaK